MKPEISFLGIGNIKYREGKKTLTVYTDFREPFIDLSLKSIRAWDAPYDNEEISLKKKQEILKNIYDDMVEAGWDKNKELNFNYSIENGVRYSGDIIYELQRNIPLDDNLKPQKIILDKFSAYSFVFLHDTVKESARFYYELSFDEKMKFKEEMDSDVEQILNLFVNSKLNRDMSQKDFTYGLYALDMLLKSNNREEVRKTLKAYLEIGQECKLHHKDIMSKPNSYLAELIKEVEKTL